MVRTVDIKGYIDSCVDSKVTTVWYAVIDGKVFKSGTGHCFFYRRCDLLNALHQSPIQRLVDAVANNYIDFFKDSDRAILPKDYREVYKKFWDAFVGDTTEYRCRICSLQIPVPVNGLDELMKELSTNTYHSDSKLS